MIIHQYAFVKTNEWLVSFLHDHFSQMKYEDAWMLIGCSYQVPISGSNRTIWYLLLLQTKISGWIPTIKKF